MCHRGSLRQRQPAAIPMIEVKIKMTTEISAIASCLDSSDEFRFLASWFSSTTCLPEGEGSESNRKRENPYQSSSIQVVALEFRGISSISLIRRVWVKNKHCGYFETDRVAEITATRLIALLFLETPIKAAPIDARFVLQSILRFPV